MVSSQLIVIVVALIVLILVLCLAKSVVRIVLSIGILVIGGISFGLFSPTDVINTATAIKENGIEVYESFASASNNIKVDCESVQVKMGDTWVDLNAVNNFKVDGDTVSVTVGGNTYSITDGTVAQLFSTLQ